MKPNPYSASDISDEPNPYSAADVSDERATDVLCKLARLLLERRAERSGVWWYVKVSWRRQLLSLVGFAVLIVVCLRSGAEWWAIGVAAFWVGQKLRDLQWWRALVRQWPETECLLDWSKIERLAARGADAGAGSGSEHDLADNRVHEQTNAERTATHRRPVERD
jgi:hypothetical protein